MSNLSPEQFFRGYFSDLNAQVNSASALDLEALADEIDKVRKTERKVIIVGNGGSAAIASHVSVDLTKTLGIRAINFNEADLLTCFSNDYGYEHWVTKALEFYGDKGDLAILISSSGASPNIINGAKKARQIGLRIVTLSGFSKENVLCQLGDINLWANCRSYNLVEMTHLSWLLSVIDYIAKLGRESPSIP